MENYKYIDITQLPEDLWQDAKNLIALDSNGDVIKAAKKDTYSKDEIDDLLKDAEISADKLQNKIKINSASTDYIVTQPTVSGDSLVITDSMSDKNQYHTFGYDKTITTTSNKLLDYSTPLFRGTNAYNCPQWDGNSIKFQFISGMKFRSRLSIPYKYNGNKYVTHIDAYIQSGMFFIEFGYINGQNFVGYQSVPFKKSEIYKSFGAIGTFIYKKNDVSQDYYNSESTYNSYIFPGDTIELKIANFSLTFENGEIETPRFYILSNNFIYGDVPTENYTSDYPERLNDYIRYSNDVKAYILTDKNTKFKTINGEQITGDGNIEVSANVDLSDYATKEELNTKQDVISDLQIIRSGAALGATALQSVPSEYATEQWVNSQGFLKEHQDISNLATKEELNDKQDVISDLDTIRSGAAKGATALQEVPDTYALKSEIPDITTKQDKLVSGSNIKSINGSSLLGSGNMELATKEELNAKQNILVSGENIKSINGTSLLGSGNIVIEASADNVPTLQTSVQGTTNNYIYSSGQNDKYGVISDFYTDIVYASDRASIHTDWYYWGNTDKYMVDGAAGWSIEGATTSQAGLMSASDKTKLDGIDLSTKQDTLVSGTNIKTVNGTSLLGSGNISIDTNVDLSNYATKSELNSKQDVINDLETIRSGAALGATALQSVPDTYALKSEIPDITTKQDKLVSGTNIKTINGNSLLGSGDITIEGGNVDLSDYYTKSQTNALVNPKLSQVTLTQAEYDALSTKENNVLYIISDASTTDSSDYYTKAEIDAMIGGASSTITEINNLVV